MKQNLLRILKSVLLYIVTSVMLFSCAAPGSRSNLAADGMPNTVYVTYFPYIKQIPEDYKPIPEYHGWSIDRMERDLMRINSSGFAGIIVAMEPAEFADENKFAMLNKFLEIMDAKYPEMKLALYFVAEKEMQMDRENVGMFIIHNKLIDTPQMLKINGHIPLFFSENISLGGEACPGIVYYTLERKVKPEHFNGERHVPYPAKACQDFGQCFGGYFVTSAEKPKFAKNINKYWKKNWRNEFALSLSSLKDKDLVIFSSWNDYASRNAIEPNSKFDSDMADYLRLLLSPADNASQAPQK